MRRKRLIIASVLLALALGLITGYQGLARRGRAQPAVGESPSVADRHAALIETVPGHADEVRLSDAGNEALGIQTAIVKLAPAPAPLRLTGSLLLDSNRLVRIHSRFQGELISIGSTEIAGPDGKTEERSLRYGDKVAAHQLLAVISSKDIGEKKSELIDAISKRDVDKILLEHYEAVGGVVPARTIYDARRNYEGDLIAVAKAERTLRSWHLGEEEIAAIYAEAKRVQAKERDDPRSDRAWAQTEVRSPIAGTIIEKNFNVGDIVDTTQDLFKIADLTRIEVLANAYEEDLPLLRSLAPEQRVWRIDIKADPNDVPVKGTFDTIGSIIDPTQHSGAVMGSLANPNGRLSAGEFITATIDLPADPALVVVPTAALVDDATGPYVFVETELGSHEFKRCRVAVVKRGRENVTVRSRPQSSEEAHGVSPLEVGRRVVAAGAMRLAAELDRRQASLARP